MAPESSAAAASSSNLISNENRLAAYGVMGLFAITNTIAFILVQFQNLQLITNESGDQTQFYHPLFQANTQAVGEFIVIVCFVYPVYKYFFTVAAQPHQTLWWEFLLPAFFDWADTVFLFLGLAYTLTTPMTPLIRSLVIPLTCLTSKLLL